MKNILILLMLLVSAPIFAQSRLGTSLDSIKAEFTAMDSRVTLEKANSGRPLLKIEMGNGIVIYYFDDNNKCDETVIQPSSLGGLNSYVERYNKNYVIISGNAWRAYMSNFAADIELIYPKGKVLPFFMWTLFDLN